ncbi:MAG TPA: DinB family protein [Anaerolineales bacterium]
MNPDLDRAIEEFVALALPLTEADLAIPWTWKDHDEEGKRFAFFVTLQELQQLAVQLEAARNPPTQAQWIVRQYHAQYLDLQAALLGVSAEESERAPAEKEWAVRRVYSHILTTDLGFSTVVRFALERHRNGNWTAERYSDEDEARLEGLTEEQYQGLIDAPLGRMREYHAGLHSRLIDEFSRISDAELDLPSTFWEETRFPIRHRLHRFAAHMIQHTVQIDKTLHATGSAPGESKRLLRNIYAALAQADGALIGAGPSFGPTCRGAADRISARVRELRGLLP